MARLLSSILTEAMFGERTDDGLLMLLTITHPDEPTPIRLVANGRAVTSRGNLFEPFPFDIQLPDDEQDTSAVAKFIGDNVSRRIIGWLRTQVGAPSGMIEAIRMSDPNSVEMRISSLQFLEPQTPDSLTISSDMTIIDYSEQRYLQWRYIAAYYPALSRAAT